MMIAKAIGRPTLISTESFIKTSARVTGATVKHGRRQRASRLDGVGPAGRQGAESSARSMENHTVVPPASCSEPHRSVIASTSIRPRP